jgi:hypothetical protein
MVHELVHELLGTRTTHTLVGDRGMITSARIEALRELGGLSWITCLRAPAIKALAADDGPLQMSLFDTQDLAEISNPDYPGERLIACRNPVLAQLRAAKRESLLAATEALLTKIATRVAAGRLAGADAIGVAVGKVIDKYKMAKHLAYRITDTALTVTRDQAAIAEAALDGVYVIGTSVPAARLDAAGTVGAYKALSHVERDFRNIKADDLDLRPDPPLPARPGPRPRADLHARPVPGLAPAPHPGPADLHRRAPASPRQPRRPGHPLHHSRPQGRPPHLRRPPPGAQLPRPA